MRGLVNVPLVAGKTGGIRNAAQLALSLMGAVRDTPHRGLGVQEGADILMHTPATEFVTPLPKVSAVPCVYPGGCLRHPSHPPLPFTSACALQELAGAREGDRVAAGASGIIAKFLGVSIHARPGRSATKQLAVYTIT